MADSGCLDRVVIWWEFTLFFNYDGWSLLALFSFFLALCWLVLGLMNCYDRCMS